MYTRMSSAYFSNSTPAGIESFMSAMKSKKRTGPRTLPWMTPASTGFHSVVVVPIFSVGVVGISELDYRTLLTTSELEKKDTRLLST